MRGELRTESGRDDLTSGAQQDRSRLSWSAMLHWPIEGGAITGGRQWLDVGRERVEGDSEPVVGWFVGGDFVVAAAKILYERMSCGQGLR